MKRKNKKHVLLPAALIVYMICMAVIAYPNYQKRDNMDEFFLIVGIGLLLPIILYFVLRRKQKVKDRFMKND